MIKDKKLFLFDIDGVIKLGDTLIDGALELYNSIKTKGGKSIFITNNSTKSGKDYVSDFQKLGFDVSDDNFITALTVSTGYLKEHHPDDLIYILGTKSLEQELRNAGLNVTTKIVPDIKVLLVGYDKELTYQKIQDACQLLQTQQIEYLATNLDLKCPMPFGFVPDCGAITKMIETATDKVPKFLGKPSPEMVFQSIKSSDFSKDETVVVGDRLYTDIACGINAGVDTCVVFTGEAKKEDLIKSDIIPTFQFESVKEINEEYMTKQ